MEKLLDRPRAFEESKLRYILALEAQRRAQILVISNAQRKLVFNFQQKLKSSATVAQRHSKWMRDVKTAKECMQTEREKPPEGKEQKERIRVKVGSVGNVDDRGKTRPKTTGTYVKDRRSYSASIERYRNSGHHVHQTQAMIDPLTRASCKNDSNIAQDSITDLKDCSNEASYYRGNSPILTGSSSPPVCQRTWNPIVSKPGNGGKRNNDKIKTSFAEGDLDVRGTKNSDLSKKDVTTTDNQKKIVRRRLRSTRSLSQKELNKNNEESQIPIFDAKRKTFLKSRSFHVRNYANKNDVLSVRKSEPKESFENAFDDVGDLKYEDCEFADDSSKRISTAKSDQTSNSRCTDLQKRKASCKTNSSSSNSKNIASQNINVERKMSYELRTWISDIKKDVKRVQSCIEDKPLDKNVRDSILKNRSKSEDSSNSSFALEKFDAIFQDLCISGENCGENYEFQDKKKMVDASSFYAKAAAIDSRLDSDQNWHKRDPRNKKLKPPILL